MSTPFELLSAHASFGGAQRYYVHESREIGLPMKFSVYLPPKAILGEKVPALLFLAGLTCTEETFMVKAAAQRWAAELGMALITCDTSPRGANVKGESDSWDFGVGAGFYLNAQRMPWERNWRMESYIVEELLPMLGRYLPIDMQRLGISGHSMGGHGALTLALRHPGLFKSLSAFAPIANPSHCAWGQKAFTGYLGDNQAVWAQHDATLLMQKQGKVPYPAGILIDQGMADKFLHEKQLLPEALEAACAQIGQPLNLRRQGGYDHGYYFIQTFIEDHLRHHAQQLTG